MYALGVLLYELLTGHTPFDARRLRAAAFAEIQRIIREDEPPKPSTRLASLSAARRATADAGGRDSLVAIAAHRGVEPGRLGALVRGELDWIVMTALEKDRRRRYETAGNLAADVQRHLADEAVVAAPPGAGYRLRKAVRRHRRAAVLAGTVAGALLAGSGLATFGLMRARTDAAHARTQTARAESVGAFLQDMLASVDPALAEGRGVTVGYVLGEALKKIDAGALRGQPQSEASMRLTIGATYLDLADAPHRRIGAEPCRPDDTLLPVAETQLRRAVEIRTETLGAEHPATLAAIHTWGVCLHHQKRFAELEPIIRRNLEIRARVLGESHPDTLDTMDKVTWMLLEQGHFADAEPIGRRVLELRRRVHGDLHAGTLESLDTLGDMLAAARRHAEAEAIYREELEGAIRYSGEDGREAVQARSSLADVLIAQGRPDEAEPLLARDLATHQKADSARSTSWTLWRFAAVRRAQGRVPEAVRMQEEAALLERKVRGEEDSGVLCSLHIAAKAYRDLGDSAKAEAMLRDVVEIRRRVKQPDQIRWTLESLWDLAGLYETQRRYDLAEPLLQGAHEEAMAEPTAAAEHRRISVERLIRLYEAWDRAEPGGGFDTKQGHWQDLLKGETR